jgi:hypothetical protein
MASPPRRASPLLALLLLSAGAARAGAQSFPAVVPAGCTAAVASWSGWMYNTNIGTTDKVCVVTSGAIPSHLPQPRALGYGRCWYSSLADAQAVCSAYANTCCGVTQDNNGYEPRGDLGECFFQPWSGFKLMVPTHTLTCASPPPPPPSPSPPPTSVVRLIRTETAGRAFPVLATDSNATGALVVTVTATYTAEEGTWRTLFNFAGLSAQIYTSSVNVGAPGAPELVVPNFLSFSNAHGGSTRCSQGAYLISAHAHHASWPLNTEATLSFPVDASGAVGVPHIEGVPFELVAFPKDASWTPACAPVVLTDADALYVGAQSGAADDFSGSIRDVVIQRVGI